MEAEAEPEEEPWELKLERALLSRLAPAPDDDEEEEEDAQIIAPNEEDRSAQLDELVALKSIFGDDLRGPAAAVAASICAGDDDDDEAIGNLLRFDLTIRLDDEPRRIDVRVGSGAPAATVVRVPPVALHAIFPRDYPSASPPLLALTASWLPPEATDAACDTMTAMWTPGAPAVFEMAGWLAESSVDECFAPGGALNLEGCNPRRRGREALGGGARGGTEWEARPTLRGVCTSRDAQEALFCLLRHDAVEKERRFSVQTHRCGVCLEDDVLGADFVRLCKPRCDHRFCARCVTAQATVLVRDGTVGSIVCPEPGCGAPPDPEVLRSVLSPEDFARWERLTLERSLDAMSDLVYCPRCEAPVIEDADGDHCGRCASCMFVFCSLCRESWHPGETCLTPERRLQVLESRSRGDAAMGDDARRRHREQVADAMAQRYIDREGKQCPRCNTGVVKSEGCNKMTCGGCGCFFCYKCGKEVFGYEHFREGDCSLFDLDAIAAWEREMNAAFVVQENRNRDAHVRGGEVRQTRCPKCRQPNWKLERNNHVRCWSCNQHFCCACMRVVRRGQETRDHYGTGPGKCRQHSAD